MSSAPLRVCSFESRRQDEMAQLIRRFEGIPTIAPSLKEVPLQANDHVLKFGDGLLDGRYDGLIFLTGVGTTALFNLLQQQIPENDLVEAVQRCRIVARGPKPAAVLRSKGIPIDHLVPEPNTWRELITELESSGAPLRGMHFAIQEYGSPNPELCRALEERGAQVTTVPVYRWEHPDDLVPLENAIRSTVSGDFDVLLWTSAQQLTHAVQVAERLGLREQWIAATRRCVVGSIGPVASERLNEFGIVPDVEPSHPKMAHLVRETLEAAPSLLPVKQGQT